MRLPDPRKLMQPDMYSGDTRPPIIDAQSEPIRTAARSLLARTATKPRIPQVRLPKTTKTVMVKDAQEGVIEHAVRPAKRFNIPAALGVAAVLGVGVPMFITTVGESLHAQAEFNHAQDRAFQAHDKVLRGVTVIMGGEGVVGCSLPSDARGCEVTESVSVGRALVLLQPLTHKGLNTLAAAKPGWKPSQFETERTRVNITSYYNKAELKDITTVQDYSLKHPLKARDSTVQEHPETPVGLSTEINIADLPAYLTSIGAVPLTR